METTRGTKQYLKLARSLELAENWQIENGSDPNSLGAMHVQYIKKEMETHHDTEGKIIVDAFDKANIPIIHAEKYEPSLLLKMIEENPNPKDFRQEIFDITFRNHFSNVFDHDAIALELAMFFYEDYPELVRKKERLQEIVELVKQQAQKAKEENLTHAFTDHVRENYVFSKYKKLKDLAEQQLKNVAEETLSISFGEFAIQIFEQFEQEVEEIFEKCGFSYSTKYVYGEEKEVKLDSELQPLIWIVYNRIKH